MSFLVDAFNRFDKAGADFCNNNVALKNFSNNLESIARRINGINSSINYVAILVFAGAYFATKEIVNASKKDENKSFFSCRAFAVALVASSLFTAYPVLTMGAGVTVLAIPAAIFIGAIITGG